MRFISVLLLLAVAVSAATLVVTYDVKATGGTNIKAAVREVHTNTSPATVNISGVVIPPYSAIVIEKELTNVYPPPLRVDVDFEYLNGTLSGGVLWSLGKPVISARIRIYNLLPNPAVVVISVATSRGVAVLYEKNPTSITQISGSTVYYWTILVENETEFILTFRVIDWGSFGAVRLPPISISTAVDLDESINATRRQRESLQQALTRLGNFTNAVAQFTNLARGTVKNLTQLIQLFNLTGTALLQGAVAVNTSTYAVEAFRRQIAALGDAAKGVAETLNRSLLLVDYQYAALIAAANALEAQSSALASYAAVAGNASETLGEINSRLGEIRSQLYALRGALDNAIQSIENVERQIQSSPLPPGVVNRTSSALGDAVALLRTIRSTVDSAIGSVDNAMAIVESAKAFSDASRQSLKELAPLLRATAAATRGNATALKRDMPHVLLNASKNLVEVSENLYKTAREVAKYLAPLQNASKTLREVGLTLQQSAKQLDEYRRQQLAQLPKLGLIEAVVRNYIDALSVEINQLKLKEDSLKKYRDTLGYSQAEFRWNLELPVAVLNITISLATTTGQTEARPTAHQPPFQLALVAIILTLAAMFLIKIRK